MGDNEAVLKKCANIAVLALLLLLAGAVYYYRERMLFGDAPYIVVHIINDSKLYIQELRFGSVVTQIVPLVLSKLHVPLKTILLAYSVSFDVFFLLVAFILIRVYRQYGLAILLSLYGFLLVSQTYFWTNNEIHQAVAWMFLFLATTIHLGKKNVNFSIQLIIFFLLGATTVFTHILVILPCGFLWGYLMLEKSNWPFTRKRTIILSSVLAVIILAKLLLSMKQPYDGPRLHDPTHFSLHDILNTFGNIAIIRFLQRCVTNYWIAILLYAAGLYALTRQKEKRLILWTLACTLSYIVAMKLAFGGFGDMSLFYIESEWAAFSIVLGTAFVYAFLPRLKPYIAMSLLVLVFLIRTVYIVNSAPLFSERTAFKEKVLTAMEQKQIMKLVIDDSAARNAYLISWSLPDEGILLSALNGNKPQRSFLFAEDDFAGKVAEAGNTGMIDCYSVNRPTAINAFYFQLDTVTSYKVMTTKDLFK